MLCTHSIFFDERCHSLRLVRESTRPPRPLALARTQLSCKHTMAQLTLWLREHYARSLNFNRRAAESSEI